MSDEFDLNMNLRIHFEKDIKNFLSTDCERFDIVSSSFFIGNKS